MNGSISISDVVFPRNEKVRPPEYPELPFVGLDDVEAQSMRLLGTKSSTKMKSSAKRFYSGDVLYSRLRPYLNKVWRSDRDGICSAEFIVLPGNDYIDPKFLALRLNASDFVAFANSLNTGDRPRIDFDQFSSYPLPPFPLTQQHRIVAKIEALFSELDKGIESLLSAREQLKVYRQALLKHAFEGKLTKQWREDNASKLETADELLVRIQQEREARYQQQLEDWGKAIAEWEAGGKEGRKPVKPKKPNIKGTVENEYLKQLPPLSIGFSYFYLSDLGDLARGKSKHRPRNAPVLFGGKYPFIQTGEVKAAGRMIKNYTQTLSEIGLAQSKLWPQGTLCITIAANIAETAFLGFDGCFPDSIVGFSALDDVSDPEYIELFIKSARVRIESYAPATAQKNINLTTLENLVVPVTSLVEQKLIVKLLGEQISIIDKNEIDIDASLKQVEALRQSILKKAFSGKLVPQDPSDEPASELLKRIATERAELEAAAKAAKAAAKKTHKARAKPKAARRQQASP